MPIENDFPFLMEKSHIVSFVGGGGKTTLMYAMAAHCVRKNWHVLVTTTTHIMRPAGAVWAQTDAELFRLWKHGSYAVAGTAAPGGKMTVPPQKQLEHWMQLADIVLIEADGSRRMPCKAPAAHEPVLLPQCDIVLAVAGVSALGESLEKGCFRAELAQQILRVSGNAVLTPTLLAKLFVSESGGKKAVGERSFYAVLNQADTPQRQLLGKQTLCVLQERYRVNGVLTQFEERERA